MTSINLDNPLLLLLIIPFAAALVVPFFLLVKKDVRKKNMYVSLAIHVLMVVLLAFAAANPVATMYTSKTEVYVLADVSHSTSENLDKIDACIDDLEDKLPRNSKLGVVAFGKDCELLTELGAERKAVAESSVDTSATDIVSALNFTADLFSDDAIKRIVLITDGLDTTVSSNEVQRHLFDTVENFEAEEIFIDAVYLDSTLGEDAKEVQISDADFTYSAFINTDSVLRLTVESTHNTRVTLKLTQNGVPVEPFVSEELDVGYNNLKIKLPTDVAGTFEYGVTLEAAEGADTTVQNNNFSFVQRVSDEMQVLLISSKKADKTFVEQMFSDKNQKVDVTHVGASLVNNVIPSTVSELIEYDQIIISDYDISKIENPTSFVSSLDKVVSQYGKTLMTAGNLGIQNEVSGPLNDFGMILPVEYGNNAQDPKLYAIVIDTSRSMINAGRLRIMKETAIQLLNLFDDEDLVCVVSFSGNATVLKPPTKAAKRAEIAELISSIEPTQGTFLGKGMTLAYDTLSQYTGYDEKQLILISDGMSYSLEPDDPQKIADDLYNSGVSTSVINPLHPDTDAIATLQGIAAAGNGEYYYISGDTQEDIKDIINKVEDDIKEAIIEVRSEISVEDWNDAVMNGIDGTVGLPDIYGYAYTKAKSSATVVLTTEYLRNDGRVETVPIYSYCDYDRGRVITLSTSLTGDWVRDWNTENTARFYSNVADALVPQTKNSVPYLVDIIYTGAGVDVVVTPSEFGANAAMTVDITAPNAAEATKLNMAFMASTFSTSFAPVDAVGSYKLEFTYSIGTRTYQSVHYLDVPYMPEYNEFLVSDKGNLVQSVGVSGTVTDDGTAPNIRDDGRTNGLAQTYEYSFSVVLLIICAALFVIDVLVRRVRWNKVFERVKNRKKKGEAK